MNFVYSSAVLTGSRPLCTELLSGHQASTILSTRKLEALGHMVMETASFCVPLLWRTDGQTDMPPKADGFPLGFPTRFLPKPKKPGNPGFFQNRTRAHHEMRYPNVTWCIILYGYLFTTELRHMCTSGTFRVSLLSTFRVSSINYSLVCSLPLHTGSSANVEGPRTHSQSKSCKMLHECYVRQITFEKACNDATCEWP